MQNSSKVGSIYQTGQAPLIALADLKWPGFRKAHNQPQPSLTDILAYREPDEDPIFERAMHVVDTLATQSTCHQAAAAQLLVTCKAVGANMAHEDGKHELLERAKSVYAVRVAVCETGEGRAEVPSACQPILHIPQRLDHEIDVLSSKTVAPCLGALMIEHYYWTSYSNNRQDANTLCLATTLESTRLEALHSYQKLAELLPEFRAALGLTRSRWLDFLQQQQEEAEHINKLQRQNREEVATQHKSELGSFRDIMKMAKDGLVDVSQSLQRAVASTDSDITQTREVRDSYKFHWRVYPLTDDRPCDTSLLISPNYKISCTKRPPRQTRRMLKYLRHRHEIFQMFTNSPSLLPELWKACMQTYWRR